MNRSCLRGVFSEILLIILFPAYLLSAGIEPSWQLPTGGTIIGYPAVSPDGTIYAVSEDRHLYAVSSGGEFLWKHYLHNLPLGGLSAGPDGSVYLSVSNGETVSVNPSGREIWRFQSGSRTVSGYSVSYLGFIYFGNEEDELSCLDNRGTLRWKIKLLEPLSAAPTHIPGWGIVVPQTGGRITAINMLGQIRWHFLASGNPGQVIFDGKNFYVTTAGGTVLCIDREGDREWSRNIGEEGPSGLIIHDGCLYFLTGSGSDGAKLYSYDIPEKKLEYIELEKAGNYLAAVDEHLLVLSGRGELEIFTGDLIPVGMRRFTSKVTGTAVHPDGTIVTGGGDWRIRGFQTDMAGSEGWNQPGGGCTRQSTGPGFDVNPGGEVSPDEMYLRQMAGQNSENSKILVLKEIKRGLDSGNYSGCEPYILEILETLAGEGVLNPLYQEGKVTNDYPLVRIKAARILAEHGTLKSQSVLLSVFGYEWESAAAAAQMEAMGRIGSDLKGSITRSICEKLPVTGSLQEKRTYAVSALSVLKQLVKYMGTIPDPAALDLIMTVYRGNYGRQARKLAMEFMGS